MLQCTMGARCKVNHNPMKFKPFSIKKTAGFHYFDSFVRFFDNVIQGFIVVLRKEE